VTEAKNLFLILSRIGSSGKRTLCRAGSELPPGRYGAAGSFGIPNLSGVVSIHSKKEDALANFFYNRLHITDSRTEENQFLFD
jgi:hypothetical protein